MAAQAFLGPLAVILCLPRYAGICGVAPERAYKVALYHPFNWRGWQAYGTGQLGDFGCHILDPVFKSLKLTAPSKLTVDAPPLYAESWTDRSTMHYEFPRD